MRQAYRARGALEQSRLRVCECLRRWRIDQRFSRQSFSAHFHEMLSLHFRPASFAPLTSSIEDQARINRQMAHPHVKRDPFADYVRLQLLPKYVAVHQRPDVDGVRQALLLAPNESLALVLFLARRG